MHLFNILKCSTLVVKPLVNQWFSKTHHFPLAKSHCSTLLIKPMGNMTFLSARRPEKALRAPTRTVQHSQKQYKNEWLRAADAWVANISKNATLFHRGIELFNIAYKTNQILTFLHARLPQKGARDPSEGCSRIAKPL